MRVLITHNYYLRLDPKQWEAQKPYAPLATLYAAAALRQAGHEVYFHDVQFREGPTHFEGVLKKVQPQVVILYEDGFNYLTKMCLTNMRQAAFTMMGYAKSYGAAVFISGSDSTDHTEDYLQKGADAVMIGEADKTLLELLDPEKNIEEIAGLVWQTQGKIVRNKPRAVHTQLDGFSKPAWDLLDISPYKNAWKKHGYFSVNVATTRGCPFKCNWCAKPIYGNRYNSHSPQYIVDLIKEMKAQFDFDHIWFCDDIFGLKPGWVQEFSNLMAAQHLRIPFKIQSRADLLVKENTVEALASAGCDEVWIGAESGSQKVLDAMDKGTTVQQIAEATAMMKKHGIKPCFFLQFGYPGEEWQDIEKTLNMVDDLQPFDIGVSVSYPLPGTKFYKSVKSQLIDRANWTDSDELLMMYRGTFSPEFYKKLHRFLHRRFRAAAAQRTFLSKPNPKSVLKYLYHKPLSFLEEARVLKEKNAQNA